MVPPRCWHTSRRRAPYVRASSGIPSMSNQGGRLPVPRIEPREAHWSRRPNGARARAHPGGGGWTARCGARCPFDWASTRTRIDGARRWRARTTQGIAEATRGWPKKIQGWVAPQPTARTTSRPRGPRGRGGGGWTRSRPGTGTCQGIVGSQERPGTSGRGRWARALTSLVPESWSRLPLSSRMRVAAATSLHRRRQVPPRRRPPSPTQRTPRRVALASRGGCVGDAASGERAKGTTRSAQGELAVARAPAT